MVEWLAPLLPSAGVVAAFALTQQLSSPLDGLHAQGRDE